MDIIKKAVKAAGNMSKLARACGVTPQAVRKWVVRGQIPAEQVLNVEKATEMRVTRYELRPDIYPL
tara:strand:+ start:589 stop:786 length:198 start_codon:yes stop_codon:yes gene_type:complete